MFLRGRGTTTCLVAGILALSVFIKTSFIFGSFRLSFSLFTIILPLLGAFSGVAYIGGVLALVKVLRYALFGFIPVFTGIPTLFAAWCWSLEYKRSLFFEVVINVLVPLICFMIFMIHPFVGNGFFYAFYWFIPVILYGLRIVGVLKKNVMATALRSTFIAHAVGSVFWLFSVPMTPEQWLALIPVVAVERFVFAGLMVLGYHGIRKLSNCNRIALHLQKKLVG